MSDSKRRIFFFFVFFGSFKIKPPLGRSCNEFLRIPAMCFRESQRHVPGPPPPPQYLSEGIHNFFQKVPAIAARDFRRSA